jgi:hypothetical protein
MTFLSVGPDSSFLYSQTAEQSKYPSSIFDFPARANLSEKPMYKFEENNLFELFEVASFVDRLR